VATAKNTREINALSAFYAKPTHDASYWAAKTAGMDFSREDRVDAAKYNLIQWQGLIGVNIPYPAMRDGRDLSKNREPLLRKWREARVLTFQKNSSTGKTGGGS